MYKYGSVSVQSEREQEILYHAGALLNGINPTGELIPPDEATIDASFLFRFDPAWCRWVSKIRQMMRAFLGQTGDASLSTEDGARLKVHLEANAGTTVGLESGPNGGRYTMSTETGGYRCFDQGLREALETTFLSDESRVEFERLWKQVWLEASQTGKIQRELRRLALAYNLIPHEHESDNYTPNEAELMFKNVVNYVIRGHIELSFRWPKTKLIESKTGNGIERTIRPHKWPGGTYFWTKKGIRQWTIGKWRENKDGSRTWIEDAPGPSKRMTKAVRVRTWAIYYLTRRGGGERTEQLAVDLWNDVFPDNIPDSFLDVRNFRAERERLFRNGTLKNA